MTPPDARAAVAVVRPAVDAALDAHLDALSQELAGLGDATTPLLDAFRSMLGGGKRMRAALCHWSWRAHGGHDAGQAVTAVRLGAAIELFQAAALFHDDVMDDSDTRRGLPSAHRVFEAQHAAGGRAGSSRRFGESAAILLGDLALIACDREVAAALVGLAPDRAAAVREVFDAMRTEVTVGQYLDVLGQTLPLGVDAEAEEAQARRVLRAKSARYSVEHPLTLGALLAGAPRDAVARCRDVGLALGEAFQLRDDLLGVFGEPALTGKPAGDDLREGKRTVLVARALRTASGADRQRLLDGLGRPDLGDADVEELRGVLRRSGAVDAVEALITELAEPALDALASAPLSEPGRSTLVALGRAAVHRTT